MKFSTITKFDNPEIIFDIKKLRIALIAVNSDFEQLHKKDSFPFKTMIFESVDYFLHKPRMTP